MEEKNRKFINYAHRGASAYNPENTVMSFYEGIRMGADGIETDVQLTSDGVPVLFHDSTLLRVTGEEGSVSDYTLEELRRFTVKKDGLFDRIPTLEEFLDAFSWRELTFAIELKQAGAEEKVYGAICRHGLENKCVVTSFKYDYLCRMHEVAPMLHLGWLKGDFTEENIEEARKAGIGELCPKVVNVTEEKVSKWHEMGFNVRAWGVGDTDLMKQAYFAGVNGMTVNFPDKLVELISGQRD